jgi:putative ABC transport system ATP-binding protein
MVTHDSSIARRAPRLATIEAGQITLTEQGGRRPLAQQYVQQ